MTTKEKLKMLAEIQQANKARVDAWLAERSGKHETQ
jgi:hypothetical protein